MIRFSHELISGRIRWVLLVVILAAVSCYAYFCLAMPQAPASSAADRVAFQWPAVSVPGSSDWAVFQSGQGSAPANFGPLARRFRLAGTFFAFGDAAGPDGSYCKAVLDDLEKKDQYLVREGDALDDVQVVRILRDRIVLRSAEQQEELWLSFSGSPPPAASPGRSGREPVATGDLPALEENRFGKRVGENRWVLSRDALMSYYKELTDDPERLAAVYVSMKPDYDQGKIGGYLVDIEGEKDFFHAAGLRNGDVVRKVNSMKMTSQKRAEYFIGEFVKNRVNAIVLDVERDKQPKKLIYLIR